MASPSPLSAANTAFSVALLTKLSDDDKTANVFFSPFSISSALAMVMLGAGGNTAAQMTEVLRFADMEKLCKAAAEQTPRQRPMPMQRHGPRQRPMPTQTHGPRQMPMQRPMPVQMPMQMQQETKFRMPEALQKMMPQQACLRTQECRDDVHASFAQVLSVLNKEGAPYALSVANRLYGEQSYQFVEDFLGKTRKHYSAELEQVDFINSFEAARHNINGWVESQTQGKIKDLLGNGVLDNMTRLVLVNAIYFKGHWDHQFKESQTRDGKFRLNKNETKPVKMMFQKRKFPLTFIPEANCQILEMPYKDKELSMLIFLPMNIEDSSTGLEKLESELTYENFMEWTRPDMMDETEVQVGLPRFKLEQTYDLKNVLVSMGMVDAFDMSLSDFSGMSPANDLVLSKVVHKAFVEVNEEGTEAAAATAAIMMLRCAMITPPFIADHPFLFFIRHNPSRSVLFAGRYCSP